MSGSVEVVLWLHEYELKALDKHLASNGTDVEKRMQEMLADLYSECVPFEERQAICTSESWHLPKTEQSPVQQESVGCHTPSAYDLLDILFVVQRQMEVIHKTQQEEFSSSKTLENSFQVVSDHLETLLDSMSMWIADMEDMTQVPLQEHENEDLTGMQMG